MYIHLNKMKNNVYIIYQWQFHHTRIANHRLRPRGFSPTKVATRCNHGDVHGVVDNYVILKWESWTIQGSSLKNEMAKYCELIYSCITI